MKVLMIGHNLWINGGSDKVMLDEISLLESRGVTVIPFVSDSTKNMPSEWSDYFVKSVSFDNPKVIDIVRFIYNVEAKDKLESLIEEVNPDIIHLHIYYGKISSSIFSVIKKSKIPVVQTLHEYKLVCPVYTMTKNNLECNRCKGFSYYNCLINKCNKNSLSRSLLSTVESYFSKWNGSLTNIQAFFSVSDFQRNKLIMMGLDPNKIFTIYNPISLPRQSEAMTYSSDGYYLYYGRLSHEKGVGFLIEAFLNTPGRKLKIVGDGSLRNYFFEKIKSNSADNIELVGFKTGDDLDRLIKYSKAVIVPSTWDETFGLTVAEPMASGKIVFVSNKGALPEVLGYEKDYIFEANDLTSFYNVLDKFESQDVSHLKDISNRNRSRVENNFSEQRHLESLLNCYNMVIERVNNI